MSPQQEEARVNELIARITIRKMNAQLREGYGKFQLVEAEEYLRRLGVEI